MGLSQISSLAFLDKLYLPNMARRLPSMNALRSFEAAARHQSFALAAAELSVSPAAVGFQVKRVEEDLGFPLFVRKHRALELTLQGAKLMAELTKGFDLIEAAWHALESPDQTPIIRVTAPVAIVKRWLFNEIALKSATNPYARVSWDMSQQNRAFEETGPDAAIRYAIAPPDGMFAEPILRPWFTPHMRPDIARKVVSSSDLQGHGLIDVDYGQDMTPGLTAWRPWFIAQGLEPPARYAMNCSDTATAVDMAVDSGHIAMGGYFATLSHLADGRLVAPFDVAVRPESQFWFVCRVGREEEPEILWFREALKESALRLEAKASGLQMFDFQNHMLPGSN